MEFWYYIRINVSWWRAFDIEWNPSIVWVFQDGLYAALNLWQGKGAGKAPKSAKTPLGNSDAPNVPVNGAAQKDGRRVEEIYQKKSQLEHILLRPDTYVGSVEKQSTTVWVHEPEIGLVLKTISYVPALYKIFDEIIVNAIDNKVCVNLEW